MIQQSVQQRHKLVSLVRFPPEGINPSLTQDRTSSYVSSLLSSLPDPLLSASSAPRSKSRQHSTVWSHRFKVRRQGHSTAAIFSAMSILSQISSTGSTPESSLMASLKGNVRATGCSIFLHSSSHSVSSHSAQRSRSSSPTIS